MNRDFKGIFIPREIWLHPKLSMQAKALWAEIHSLHDRDKGGCYASDEYLADFLGLKRRRLYDLYTELKSKGLLETVSSDGRRTYRKAIPPPVDDGTQQSETAQQKCSKLHSSHAENCTPPMQDPALTPLYREKTREKNIYIEPSTKKSSPKKKTPKESGRGRSNSDPAPKEPKTAYGSDGLVMLKAKEYDQLKEAWGPEALEDLIDRMTNYIGSSGKEYKSHYHALKQWRRTDMEKLSASAVPKRTGTKLNFEKPGSDDGWRPKDAIEEMLKEQERERIAKEQKGNSDSEERKGKELANAPA